VPATSVRCRANLTIAVNFAHVCAGTLSVKPSRSVVSLIRIMPALLAVSTQLPPLAPL
jgi:hypothetical protein